MSDHCKNCTYVKPSDMRLVFLLASGIIIATVVAGIAKVRGETSDCIATHPAVVELRDSMDRCEANLACRILREDIYALRDLEDAARLECRKG